MNPGFRGVVRGLWSHAVNDVRAGNQRRISSMREKPVSERSFDVCPLALLVSQRHVRALEVETLTRRTWL